MANTNSNSNVRGNNLSNNNTGNNNRGNNNRGNNNRGNNNNSGNNFSNNYGNNNSNVRRNNANNKNSAKNNKSKSKSGSNVFMIVAIVLLVVILAVAGYMVYRYMNNNTKAKETTKQLIPYIHDASIDKRLGSLPESSQGNEYNIHFWIYVNEYGYRKDDDKCILFKGEPSGNLSDSTVENKCNPAVWLMKGTNTLKVVIGLQTVFNDNNDCTTTRPTCEDPTNPVNVDTCSIENVPLQQWVAINLSLRNNIIDIFFNGELKKSCNLKGFPITSTDDLLVTPKGGFNGYISNMKYSNKALSSDKIQSMYKDGPTLK